MQPDAKRHRLRRRFVRLGVVTVLAATAAVAIPAAATASSHLVGAPAGSAGAAGLVYGGQTSQGWPVVIEVSKSRGRVVRATAALHLSCTDGAFGRLPDRYRGLRVNKRRKFSASFGPTPVEQDDGTTSDFQGSISGTFNRARSRVSGTWRLQITDHDASGAVIHTCDSGSLRWNARQ